MLGGEAVDAVKEGIVVVPLPRMVWVTEFAMVKDLRIEDPAARKIFSHVVVDATSTGSRRPPIIQHAPNYLFINRPIEPVDFDRVKPQAS